LVWVHALNTSREDARSRGADVSTPAWTTWMTRSRSGSLGHETCVSTTLRFTIDRTQGVVFGCVLVVGLTIMVSDFGLNRIGGAILIGHLLDMPGGWIAMAATVEAFQQQRCRSAVAPIRISVGQDSMMLLDRT
jgi:hypothetical protein